MVGNTSVGAIVPIVKSDPIIITDIEEGDAGAELAGGSAPPPSIPEPTQVQHNQVEVVMPKTTEIDSIEMDRDFLCPICMQIIKDAFLTSCGHSFCYMCIVTHLENKSNCPTCSHFLTTKHIHPNFILNKVWFRNSRVVVIVFFILVDLRNFLENDCDFVMFKNDSICSE